jgi:hypothetical protein
VNKKTIPNFLDVFEKRVDSARQRIKEELDKDKHNRDRNLLKELLNDIKGLRRAIKSARSEHAARCPHCGETL